MLTERTTYQAKIRAEFESRLSRLSELEKALSATKAQVEAERKKGVRAKQRLQEEKAAREEEREKSAALVAARDRKIRALK